MGLYVKSNQWTSFTADLRYTYTHQVLRQYNTTKPLDMNAEKLPDNCRIVVTARFGTPPKSWLNKYHKVFDESLQPATEVCFLRLTILNVYNYVILNIVNDQKYVYHNHVQNYHLLSGNPTSKIACEE